MYRKYLDGIAAVCYSISTIACLGLVSYLYRLTPEYKIIVAIIAVISGYFGSYFCCIGMTDNSKIKKTIRITQIILFLLYVFVLLDFTLIDENLGRNIFNVFKWNETAFSNYLNNNTNIVPFNTIKLFISGYLNNKLNLKATLENLIGNLLVFMPLAFFVPLLFKQINRWYKLLPLVAISVMLIEFLQFIFLTGSSDIDDVILNVTGAMLFYAFLRIKSISRCINKFTFGEWNFNEK